MASVSSNPQLDQHPRSYPSLVTLLQRTQSDVTAYRPQETVESILQWLMSSAIQENDIVLLVDKLAWKLKSADLPLVRLTLHVGTLHPQLLGFFWQWEQRDGITDELKVAKAGMMTERYKRSPLAGVIEGGGEFRARTDDLEQLQKYPLMQDLKDQGIVEYIIVSMGSNESYHNAITLSTDHKDGFNSDHIAFFHRVFNVFGLHVQRHIEQRITQNIASTYLGSLAANKVLKGSIDRGSGQSIKAIIWISDLRNFSGLVDNLEELQVLAVLNVYFEALAGAAIDNGGEVLKYMGDGLLVAFPVIDDDVGSAASASVRAAEQALSSIKEINQSPPESMQNLDYWNPLKTGIALHLGDVFFGNVGSADRLDFTVIGRAVNEASRIESLTKELDSPVLISESVAEYLDSPLVSRGKHLLRGLSGEVSLYSLEIE